MKNSKFKIQNSDKLQTAKFKGLMFDIWGLAFAGCGKFVDWIGKMFGHQAMFSTLSTGGYIYLTSQVFFRHSFSAPNQQAKPTYRQPFLSVLNLLKTGFYPLSTSPIAVTNLIKGL